MDMSLKILVLFCVSMNLLTIGLEAQDYKVELEERVDYSLVPDSSRAAVNALIPAVKKVIWYKERSESGTTYEAKFKFRGLKYSMEFDEEGGFLDIEVQQKWPDLPDDHKSALDIAFSSIPDFKLKRIQGQWTGLLTDLIKGREVQRLFTTARAYEIEFKGTVKGRKSLWEGLFRPDGDLIQIREMLIGNLDNLNLY